MNNTQSGNSRLASNPLKTNQTANTQVAQKVISANLHSLHNPLGGSEIGDSSQAFQTPNMALGQNVIRTNLSSLHTSSRVAQILCLTVGYSQKKKDSVQAVLIQRYADYISLRVSVTNYPNTIGSVQRLPDDIGLVPGILTAEVCTKPTILAQSGGIHMNIPSAGGRNLNRINNIYSVQHSNHVNDVHEVDCLDLLCNSPWTTLRSNFISSLALIPISSMRERVSSADINGSLPVSLACLRAISLRMAATINPALLSLSRLTDSIPSMMLWGTRIVVICDFAFLYVDIVNHQFVVCISLYTKMRYKNTCNVYHPNIVCISHCGILVSPNIGITNTTKPDSVVALIGLLTTNVMESYDMAMYKSTQTHPKFKWRFFSCQQSRYLTVEARSEQEARSMLPDAPCLFSARIRQGVNHV